MKIEIFFGRGILRSILRHLIFKNNYSRGGDPKGVEGYFKEGVQCTTNDLISELRLFIKGELNMNGGDDN